MDLPAYIREVGVEKASVLFEESPRTVKAWMYGERKPKPHKAQKIVERTKGRVVLQGIYGQ